MRTLTTVVLFLFLSLPAWAQQPFVSVFDQVLVAKPLALSFDPPQHDVIDPKSDVRSILDGCSVTLSTTVWPEYQVDNGAIFHNKPVMQPDLFVALKCGLWIDLWGSFGLDGTGLNTDFGDEFDATIGYAFKIKELGLDVNLALPFYAVYPLNKIHGDIIKPTIEVSHSYVINDEHAVTPFFKAECYFSLGGEPCGDMYVRVGVKHNWKMTEKLSFEQQVMVLYDSGPFGFDAGFVGGYSAGLTYDLGAGWSASALLKVSTPLESLSDDRETEIVPGFRISKTF